MVNALEGGIVESTDIYGMLEELCSQNLVFIGELDHAHKNRDHINNEFEIISGLRGSIKFQLFLESFDAKDQDLLNINMRDYSNGFSYEAWRNKMQERGYDKGYIDFYRPLLMVQQSLTGSNKEDENKIFFINNDSQERTKEMARVIKENFDPYALNFVIVGNGHLGELGLPHHVGIESKVVSHEPNSYLKELIDHNGIEKGIVKVNRPYHMNYVILSKLSDKDYIKTFNELEL